MFLPDINVFIQAYKGLESDRSFLESITSRRELVLSVVVVAEFLAKASNEDEERFNLLVHEFGGFGIDLDTAKQAVVYRRQFLKRTNRTLLLDCFLAAQAKVHHLTLVTNNKSDFPMKDIKIITPKKKS